MPSQYAVNIRPTPGKGRIDADLALPTMGNLRDGVGQKGKTKDMSRNTPFSDTTDHCSAEAASLPRSSPVANEQPNDKFGESQTMDEDLIRVDYGTMQKIHALGFPMPPAANGPNDGLPEYLVHRSLWRQTQK
jgi:hypothetical protein